MERVHFFFKNISISLADFPLSIPNPFFYPFGLFLTAVSSFCLAYRKLWLPNKLPLFTCFSLLQPDSVPNHCSKVTNDNQLLNLYFSQLIVQYWTPVILIKLSSGYFCKTFIHFLNLLSTFHVAFPPLDLKTGFPFGPLGFLLVLNLFLDNLIYFYESSVM